MQLYKNRQKYRKGVHQIVWSVFGDVPLHPNMHIHHIDGDPSNNHIKNLEQLSIREHAQTKRKRGTLPTGVTLVSNPGKYKYGANISFKGKTTYLGSFETIEQASNAYQRKRKIIEGYGQ